MNSAMLISLYILLYCELFVRPFRFSLSVYVQHGLEPFSARYRTPSSQHHCSGEARRLRFATYFAQHSDTPPTHWCVYPSSLSHLSTLPYIRLWLNSTYSSHTAFGNGKSIWNRSYLHQSRSAACRKIHLHAAISDRRSHCWTCDLERVLALRISMWQWQHV